MRKTILYLVILLVLGFGVWYFLFRDAGSPFSASDAGFTFKDTAAIGKVFITSNNGESILAERTNTGWVVDKKYRALPSTVNLVLATLCTQTALYPVLKTARENVIKSMSTDAIKVEVYDRKGIKMKAIYIGGTAVNNSGTNMYIEGAGMPYVVTVPGFNGYLTSRFPTSIRNWRDRTIFNLPASEIKSVAITYPGDKSVNSFEISQNNGQIAIKADPSIMALDTPNRHRAGIFLGFFANVNCEGYINGLSDNDSTLRAAPKQSSIDVTGLHGQHQHIDIYWMALNKRSKNVTESDADVPDDYDADRLYAVINDKKDTVVIQTYVFGKIFRKGYEFFQADAPPKPKTDPRELPSAVLQSKGK
jgi:hypothetical protein